MDAHEHNGLLVTTLIAGAVLELGLVTAGAAALGWPLPQALAVGTLVPLGVSTVAALVLGAALGLRRGRRAPVPAPPTTPTTTPVAGPPVSLARRDALELVAAAEARLLRAVEIGAPEFELMRCALDLQDARLRLARLLLAEDGELPQSLQDELLVAHRGTSAWLRSPRLP